MKNKILRKITLVVVILSLIAAIGILAAGCKDDETPEEPTPIVLEAADEFHFYYDGEAHSISYTVTPSDDVTVTFTVNGSTVENSFTQIGEYEVTIKAEKEGYIAATKTVKVVIEKQSAQITAEETQLYYYQEGKLYYFISTISPVGAKRTVTIKETGEPAPDVFTEPGKYNLIVHVEGDEYYTSVTKEFCVIIAESNAPGIYASEEQVFYYGNQDSYSVDYYTIPLNSPVTVTENGQARDNVFTQKGEHELVLSATIDGQTYTKQVKAVVKDKETVTITAEGNQNFYYTGKPIYPEYTLSDERAEARFEILYDGNNTDVGVCFISIIVDETYWNVRAETTVAVNINYKETVNVFFDAQGGTLPGDDVAEMEYGVQYSLPLPTKDGSEFVTWYNTDTSQIVATSGDFWEIRQDSHLVAIWSVDRDYKDKIEVHVSASDITLQINEVGSAGVANVIALPSYTYLPNEDYRGVSVTEVDMQVAVADYNVGYYFCGIKSDVVLDRYIGGKTGTDMLYYKYYVVQNQEVLAGPFYATEIDAEYEVSAVQTDSIKGLFIGTDNAADNETKEINKVFIEDLGLGHVKVNLPLIDFIMPREDVGTDGTVYENYFINRYNDENTYKHTVNGTDYFFWKETVDELDGTIKNFTDLGAKVTLVVYSINLGIDNQWRSPYFLHYESARLNNNTAESVVYALNTSTQRSYNYILALFEFLAERYSRDPEDNDYCGQVETYVIGNEVDLSMKWNSMTDVDEQPLSTSVYTDEYYRLLRIANLAVKKYKAQNQVLTSFAHYWAQSATQLKLETSEHTYSPKAILDGLNTRSKAQGDFDWGIAAHPYGYYLQYSEMLLQDTTTGVASGMTDSYETSSLITYTNLEVIDDYLHSEDMLVNGQVRSVYITEGGLSSYANSEKDMNIQAGNLAYAYYKSANLESVKAFIYYRGWDVEEEALNNTRFGLLKYFRYNNGDPEMDKKPAYEVYKYIDTASSFTVAEKYLKMLKWQSADGKQITFEQKMQQDGTDAATTVKNIMTVIGSRDWESWSTDNIIKSKTGE